MIEANNRIEFIPINKDLLKTLDEVLAQNRKILNQNGSIIEHIVNPVLFLDNDKEQESPNP